MFKQQDNPILSSLSGIQKNDKKHHQSLYVIFAVLVVFIVIIAIVLLIPQNEIPQNDSSLLELNLNYAVGECMVYEIINAGASKITNTSYSPDAVCSDGYGSTTITLEVLSANSENYTIKQTNTSNTYFGPISSTLTLNIAKASYYNNFIAPDGFDIFHDVTNPLILAYLTQSAVKTGDVWTIPVSIGDVNLGVFLFVRTGDNTSVGISGEITLKFAGTQEITVPAGTFQTMCIEITSTVLSAHSDDIPAINIQNGVNVQLTGTSYIELGTCRLIKSDLTHQTTINTPEIEGTATMYMEKTLVEYLPP